MLGLRANNFTSTVHSNPAVEQLDALIQDLLH